MAVEIGLPAKDVVAGYHVLRAQRLPVVVTVLHVVVHAYLLQVLAATEGAVLNTDLQVAVGALRVAVGLVELYGLQVVAVGEGATAHGQRLVVVVRAGVVVDAQHAVVALQIVVVNTFDGGVVDSGIGILSHQLAGIETLIVGIPQAQLLHYLVGHGAVVGQVSIVVFCQHALVACTVHIHLVARRLVADETVFHGGPDAAILIVVQGRTGYTDEGVGRPLEHVVPDALHGRHRHGLPMVVAAGDILHQVDLLQLRGIGKGQVTDEEIGPGISLIGYGVAVLEIDALNLRLACEAMVGHAAQMGMILEEAHQVVDEDHLGIGWYRLLVDGGSGDVGFLSVHIPTLGVSVPAIVARFVNRGVEVPRVVVLGDVGVLHALVGVRVVATRCLFGHSLGFHHRAVAQRHFVSDAV